LIGKLFVKPVGSLCRVEATKLSTLIYNNPLSLGKFHNQKIFFTAKYQRYPLAILSPKIRLLKMNEKL